uniref:Uncharacterized protein n=1 Tax=Arundo donax TaxID=35708 RepID=A0A0A9CZP7_ARUDO
MVILWIMLTAQPPVVELLGEFTFADSSRARSINNLNQHAGDVDKVQKNSSIVQTPTVRRARKEGNAVKGEKMYTTPTPMRRSNRLRNKVTSP